MGFDRNLMVVLVCVTAISCDQGGGGGGRQSIGVNASNVDIGAEPAVELTLEAQALDVQEILTSDSDGESCLDFTVIVRDTGGSPLADVSVDFSLVMQSNADTGALNPTSMASLADGTATTRYCAGTAVGRANLQASASSTTVNSDTFTIGKKGEYVLEFLGSTVEPQVSQGEGEEPVVSLNLADSGPYDCTNLSFSMKKSGTPVGGMELTFSTQDDPPRGVKLAKKNEDGDFVKNDETGKMRAVYTATSSATGVFSVPFCAGVSLGTAVVSASMEDDDGLTVSVSSPVIRIAGGITNHANFSLTFDAENGRTLKGYFNTNSNSSLVTRVKLDSRQDGDAIRDYPIQLIAETGKADLLNAGRADPATGEAGFEMRALHMVDHYAYRKHAFLANPDAASRCDPEAVAASLGNDANLNFSYRNLAENWRSTVVYAVRGQEHYYDENHNGVYDGNGDGFWDKNQNGVFDADDVLTYDANGNNVFDYNGEWFIDLPTPFVDVDENGAYDSNRDVLMGDTYQAPNGVRDADTIIWKYEVYPIYMGMSPYSLTHQSIYGDLNVRPTTNLVSSGTLFAGSIDDDELFGAGANAATRAQSTSIAKFIYAHGVCGNLLPGGTKISASSQAVRPANYGERSPIITFSIQGDDIYREASRRLLKGSNQGAANAVINFNAVDHPRAEQGYPIDFQIYVPDCSNACTGDLVSGSSGIACDSQTYDVTLNFVEPESTGGEGLALSVPLTMASVNTCQCVTGAILVGDSCSCPEGQSSDGADCVANP